MFYCCYSYGKTLYFSFVRKLLIYSLNLFMTYLYPFILLPSFPCGLSSSSGIYFLDMFIESNPIPLSFYLGS